MKTLTLNSGDGMTMYIAHSAAELLSIQTSPETMSEPLMILAFSRLKKRKDPIKTIMRLVAHITDVKIRMMWSRKRGDEKTAHARMFAMHMCQLAGLGTDSVIGERFRRDSTTLVHARKVMSHQISVPGKYRDQYRELLIKLVTPPRPPLSK